MVKLKYSALYTDNLGCEQAVVYFSKDEFQLKVRGCTFKNESLNFDFHANNSDKAKRFFYLKDEELIEYVLDIKIPLKLDSNNKQCIEEFLLRVERHKNYYNNSLSLEIKGINYKVEGYDLEELLNNMNKELPEEYDVGDFCSAAFGINYLKAFKENNFGYLKKIEEELKGGAKKDSDLKLISIQHKKKFKRLQKVPITYIQMTTV